MSDELWSLVAAVAAVTVAGAIPAAGWWFGRGRQPCPHCGRKAPRTVRDVHSAAGGLAARDLTYACRACGGAVRYARRPDGEEFWEAIPEPEARAS